MIFIFCYNIIMPFYTSLEEKQEQVSSGADVKFQSRVLVFASEFYPIVSNSAVVLRGIMNAISTIKFDVVTPLYNKEISRFDRVGRVSVWRTGFGSRALDNFFFPSFGLSQARKLEKERAFHAIWVIGAGNAGEAALRFKKDHPELPLLITLQNEDDPRRNGINAIFSTRIKRLLLAADYAHVTSENLASWVRRVGINCPVAMIPSGIDYDQFAKGNSKEFYISSLKEKLSIKEFEKVILFSPFKEKYKTKNIIRALSILTTLDQACARLVVYNCRGQSGFLRRAARAWGVENNIIFLDKIDYTELSQYLWITDVLIDTEREHPHDMFLLEAFAAEVPVMITRSSVMPNFMEYNKTGVFFRSGNILNIADKLHKILYDDGLRANIIANSLNIVRFQYSFDRIKNKVEEVFERIFKI